MTDKQIAEYKKNGVTVWEVQDSEEGTRRVHVLRGNERLVFENLEELDLWIEDYKKTEEWAKIQKFMRAVPKGEIPAWQPYRGNLEENKSEETLDNSL